MSLTGHLDLSTVDALLDQVRAALADGPGCISVELSSITFIDCAGLSGLLRSQELAAEGDCRLVVIRPSVVVSRLLALTGTVGQLVRPQRGCRPG